MINQVVSAALAIILGVGGMMAYYFGANLLIDRLGDDMKRRLRPWVFVMPAVLVLSAFLVFPAIYTFYLSFTDDNPRTTVEIRVPAQFEDNLREEIVERRNGSVNDVATDGDFVVIDGHIREGQITTVGEFIRGLGTTEVFFFIYEDGVADIRFSPDFEEEVAAAIAAVDGEVVSSSQRDEFASIQAEIAEGRVVDFASELDATGGDEAVSASIVAGGQQFFVIDNYEWAFTNTDMLESFRNNLLWLILVPTFSTGLGLIIAVLADRVRWESLAKALIFLPMAISFVGASVIWRFIYFYRPEGEDQIGLLNAIVTSFGGEPVAWLTESSVNNLALIIILIWIQTGFAMVLLSAALKAVPEETIEAARIDGASEVRIFFNIIIPQVMSTIAVVMTTIIILVLKVFDIPYVMTSGEFGTEVLANVMYGQMFNAGDFPRGSTVAIILMMAVLPVMYINIRRFRREEVMR